MTNIHVTATAEFDYDTRDGLAENEAEAISDVRSALDGGRLPASSFTITASAGSPISREALLRAAYGLLGDGAGREWDDNAEYTRAIAELVRDCGVEGEDHADVLAVIRAEGRP